GQSSVDLLSQAESKLVISSKGEVNVVVEEIVSGNAVCACAAKRDNGVKQREGFRIGAGGAAHNGAVQFTVRPKGKGIVVARPFKRFECFGRVRQGQICLRYTEIDLSHCGIELVRRAIAPECAGEIARGVKDLCFVNERCPAALPLIITVERVNRSEWSAI